MLQSLQAGTTMSFAGIKDKQRLNRLRAKLDDCIRSHVQCRMDAKLQSTIKNMKVIDCIQRAVVPAPPDCRYFALSYVWGENQQPCALDGILPQTIEDSITATIYLGHRYLWIDRFVCLEVMLSSALTLTVYRSRGKSQTPAAATDGRHLRYS